MSLRENSTQTRNREQQSWARSRAGLLSRLAAAGKARIENGELSASNIFAILLFAVFALALFVALIGASSAYQRIADDSQAANAKRLNTSLLSNIVHAADSADAVSAMEGPEGDVLVLAEHLDSGTYETRLYLHEGWVVQEYALSDAPLSPKTATRLAESQTFSFTAEPRLVRIWCDEGETTVALRSHDAVTDAALDASEGGE